MARRLTEAELESIYDATIVELYEFVSRRCGGRRDLAEDITQETWVRALRRWQAGDVPDNPIGWLTTAARNLIVSHFRRNEGISLELISAVDVLALVDTNAISDSTDIAALVRRALERIPPAEAKLLETFHFDHLKMSQIAQAEGISERAVEGRLRRARERLKREIETTLKTTRGLI